MWKETGEQRATSPLPPSLSQARQGEFILSFQGEEAGKKKEREHQSNFSLDFKPHNNILSMWRK